MLSRRQILALGALVLSTAFHGTAIAGQPEIFSNSSTGIAINGYDPVAYFTQQKPVEGSPTFSSKWSGATWHFSSAENKSKFDAAPTKYAPQYGGYCAYAVSYGSTATTVPEAWSIVDGKLYLNFSTGVQKRWEKDIPGFTKKADANWPGVLN